MTKNRLEAFSDGVLAVIITIMVLELRVPLGDSLTALAPEFPVLLVYLLSFIFIGIYWNNHHHMLYVVRRIDGRIMWANLHLLFWLSLVPFVTAWMGEHRDSPVPSAAYGVVLLMAAVAYTLLQTAILAVNGECSALGRAVGDDLKGKASVALYLAAIAAAFWNRWVADALFVLVAMIWLVPDKRIERALQEDKS